MECELLKQSTSLKQASVLTLFEHDFVLRAQIWGADKNRHLITLTEVSVPLHTNKSSRKWNFGIPLRTKKSSTKRNVVMTLPSKPHAHRTSVCHCTRTKTHELGSHSGIQQISFAFSKPNLHPYVHKNTHWLLSCINRIHSSSHDICVLIMTVLPSTPLYPK